MIDKVEQTETVETVRSESVDLLSKSFHKLRQLTRAVAREAAIAAREKSKHDKTAQVIANRRRAKQEAVAVQRALRASWSRREAGKLPLNEGASKRTN